jgi:hypothetical protein
MTDNEIKEDCLQEAGIDLGRYSYNEMAQIKDALRRYHNAKLKLLSIADVSGSFLSDLNFIIDNMGYDLVKDKVSKEAQTEYLKRLKMMRDELRKNCH